jgi:peptide chain release factor subunit 1
MAFHAEIGRHSGLATEGLGAVCSALRQRAVETLIVPSEQGAAPDKTLRADEALPVFAVSRISPDGVGAVSRCAPTLH